jgi:NADPH2:quinone reductase
VQLAVARGVAVAGSAGSEKGRELVAEAGAELVLDHHRPEDLERLLEWTGGEGVNALLEMAAHLNLARDLELLAPRGRVVIIGSRGTLEIDPRATMMRDLTVLGMALPNATPEEMKTLHAALGAALRSGTLRPLVGPEFPLEEAPAAHRALFERGVYGKVVLIP